MRKIYVVLISSFLAVQFISCRTEESVKTFERPVKVFKTQSLEYLSNSYVGTVASDEISNLAFKMPGQIIQLPIENGQRVRKGELIAAIDPRDYQLQLESSKANFITSKSQLERSENLVAKDAISRQQYEAVEAAFARDKSAYENAQIMVSETKIYAPFSGIIEKRYVENYQRVQASETVVKLIDPANLEVNFTLPESNITYMSAPSKEFFVEFETYPGVQFKAKVTKFVDVSVGGSGVPVTVVIDDDKFDLSKYIIRPGFSCSVTLRIDNSTQDGVTYIPISAIYNNVGSKGDSVWIYNPTDKRVSLKGITTGELFGNDFIVVKSGITPGDDVVSAGVYQLENGQKVKLLK